MICWKTEKLSPRRAYCARFFKKDVKKITIYLKPSRISAEIAFTRECVFVLFGIAINVSHGELVSNEPDKKTESAIVSSLEGDPELGIIVDIFAEEFPRIMDNIKQAHDETDIESLRQAAHQLKGSSQSAGFTVIGEYAIELGKLAGKEMDKTKKTVDQLTYICDQVIARHKKKQ